MVLRSRNAEHELVTTSCFALSRSSRRSRVGTRLKGCAQQSGGRVGFVLIQMAQGGSSYPLD